MAALNYTKFIKAVWPASLENMFVQQGTSFWLGVQEIASDGFASCDTPVE